MDFYDDNMDLWIEEFGDSISRDEKDIIEKKLKSGEWKVNVFDKYGFTPLYIACRYLRADIVPLLIQYGADVNEKSGFSEYSPLYITVYTIHDVKRFNLPDSMSSGLKIIKLLLENNVHINCQNRQGQTPLNEAYRYDLKEVITLLSEYKTDEVIEEFHI